MGGGLIQLVAFGAQDLYLTTTKLCDNVGFIARNRVYNNFKIICNDKQLSREYCLNDLINIHSINLSYLNNKSILTNSKKFELANLFKI
jgi:hypothetical protein